MTRPQLRSLDAIIEKIERLIIRTDDSVAVQQLADARHNLQELYNSAKRDCDATESA